jgi:hypothetical protein
MGTKQLYALLHTKPTQGHIKARCAPKTIVVDPAPLLLCNRFPGIRIADSIAVSIFKLGPGTFRLPRACHPRQALELLEFRRHRSRRAN